FLRLLTPEHETRVRLTVAGTGESCGPWIECRRPGESVPKARKEFQRKYGVKRGTRLFLFLT
ncbi:MAG: hypothetical protein OXC26_23245, partial [Albidovulum sp.]|nr:hypothetical protein [Albidovulum sp.]